MVREYYEKKQLLDSPRQFGLERDFNTVDGLQARLESIDFQCPPDLLRLGLFASHAQVAAALDGTGISLEEMDTAYWRAFVESEFAD